MTSDQPQDAPHPQDAPRGEHVEVVEQAMNAEPAPAPLSRRTRLRRAVSARRPTRALLRPAALVAAGLIAGILLTLGAGALGRDGGDRGPGPGAGVADGRGGWGRGDGPGGWDRGDGPGGWNRGDGHGGGDRDRADGSADPDEDEATPGTTTPTTGPTPSGTA